MCNSHDSQYFQQLFCNGGILFAVIQQEGKNGVHKLNSLKSKNLSLYFFKELPHFEQLQLTGKQTNSMLPGQSINYLIHEMSEEKKNPSNQVDILQCHVLLD